MKRSLCSVVCLVAVAASSCGSQNQTPSESSLQAITDTRFPHAPNPSITPGALCQSTHDFRYPEHIRYCERDVGHGLKKDVFAEYDTRLGFHTQSIPRNMFKIDHLIPLCMGGSNEEQNLWPQHESIYALTDPIEPFLCGLLGKGRLKQADAVRIIREVKQAPETTDARMSQLEHL